MQNLYQSPLVVAQVDGPTLAAAAAASMLPAHAKITLPSGYFDRVGKAMRIRAAGRISSVITTPGTARFDVRMGATVVADSQAILLDTVAAHVNVGWLLDMILVARAIGSLGNLMMMGSWISEDILGTPAAAPKGSLTAVLPWNTPPAVGNNFDTSIAQTLDLFFTQTVATGSMTLHTYVAEDLN